MKPYYDDEKGIVIYHGDCRDILPSLSKVDLVLTDPPYGLGIQTESQKSVGTIQHTPIIGDEIPFDPTFLFEIKSEFILFEANN